MKRTSFIILALSLLLLSTSCSYKAEHGKTTGLVEEMIYDSVMTATVDGKSIKFDVSVVQYTNGRVMQGDSVVIYYYGDLRKGRALAKSLHLIDRPGKVLEVKHGQKPVNAEAPKTRPIDPQDLEREKKAVKAAKRYFDKK